MPIYYFRDGENYVVIGSNGGASRNARATDSSGLTASRARRRESRAVRRFGTMAEGLVGAIGAIPAAGDFATYQRKSAAQLAIYLHRVGEMGPAFERQDIAETEALLGATFDGWQETDEALENFVRHAGAEYDEVLIPLFYRRIQRQAVLLEPVLSRPEAANSVKSCAQLMARG